MDRRSAAIYAAGHFLVDFSCAYIMFSRLPDPVWFLVYNFLAFAIQFPTGILADKLGNNRLFAVTGIVLVLAGFFPFPVIAGVVLIGLGNAAYHIGGGREALLKTDKLSALGIFVSPGALGIWLGSHLSGVNGVGYLLPVLLLGLMGLVISFCDGNKILSRPGKPFPVTLLLMGMVVLIRSFVGISMVTPWKIGPYVFAAAVGAALGKAIGGILSDRFGLRKCGFFSLLAASLLFCFTESPLAGILGVVLFNMTMPITLRRAADAIPGAEGAAFGLLTLGLFAGFLPGSFGITVSPYAGALLSFISAVLLLLDRRKQNG